MANRRAAVVIGVNKTGGLTPLKSAAANAASVADWLGKIEPGYDVSLFTDDKKAVTYADIRKAVFNYTSLPTRYELLLVYFSGHGLYKDWSDTWLLTDCPKFPEEAIKLDAAIGLAKYCGIPNVIFISDACRSLPANLPQSNLNPGTLFPTHAEIEKSTTKVDSFRATGKGTSAYEAKIGETDASFLTYAFRMAYRKPRAEMVFPIKVKQKTINVVPNRRLEDFLQDTIDQAIADVKVNLDQTIEVSVPSEDSVFIAPADIEKLEEATPRELALNGGGKPLAVSLPKPRGGRSDNLKKLPGIGPAREVALNDLGIFHYDQIAGMSLNDRNWLGENLPGFKGLVEKNDLEKAAKDLAGEITAPVGGTVPRRNSFARAAANNLRAELDMKADVELIPNELASQIDHEIVARLPGDHRVAFESETGLLVHGAIVTDAVIGKSAGGEWLEILEPGNRQDKPAVIRFWDLQPGASAAVRFDDGRSILVPGLRGYIGHAHIGETGMKALSYVPSANSDRYYDYEHDKDRIERLRAAVALASEHGTFRLGSNKQANRIAASIRVGKAIDPTLGIYAAHAYWQASDDAQIDSVLDYMRMDLSVDLFDVWMLASRWPEKNKPLPVYPPCPLLTQSWSLTGVKGVQLHPAIGQASQNLSNSLWTTFGPGAFEQIAPALQAGEIK